SIALSMNLLVSKLFFVKQIKQIRVIQANQEIKRNFSFLKYKESELYQKDSIIIVYIKTNI
ncbi:hypothetical protein LJC29_07825, partial [Bacteroides sp. OttesenSCG-928-N06]|nr:hypothetical protein [Bacteroides sp. OttesenSCG-928-N06]